MCTNPCSPVLVIAPVGLTLACFRTRFVMRGIIGMISENPKKGHPQDNQLIPSTSPVSSQSWERNIAFQKTKHRVE
jgi:hypothetical protein